MENYKKLSEKFTSEAIQKTNGKETKKGYDTTGYGYQYCVDRFNEIYFDKWGFNWKIINQKEGVYKSLTPYIEITVEVSIWIEDKINIRACVGGHQASNFTDALKGAITNGFKKTAAFWGVGADAFRGTIDDDYNYPESDENKIIQEKVSQNDIKLFLEFSKQFELDKQKQDYIYNIEKFGTTIEKLNELKNWLLKFGIKKKTELQQTNEDDLDTVINDIFDNQNDTTLPVGVL